MQYQTPEMTWLLSTDDAIMESVEQPPVDIPEEDMKDFAEENKNVLDKGWVSLF
ncbi:MAG: hypothetical protein IJ009_01270 [Clostridia bacterium]|nr:hypothetical protein [Clostridia bacterium]